MNILTILGSPRKKGNTAGALDMVEQELSGWHQVERLALASVKVNGCLGCEACQKVTDRPGCVQKDDAVAVFERMMAADAVNKTVIPFCTTPDALGEDARTAARKLAGDISGVLRQ